MNTYGYALTGSFCTFEKSVRQIEKLVESGIDILPIMSYNASKTDTRFGTAKSFTERIEKLCGRRIISTIDEAEPIGPKKLIDLLIISPCSGNTLAKLAAGIYDTPVTLAAKSHLRNKRPILIGVSTNDALSSSAKNIGQLLNYKHYFFIPMKQDDPQKKPFSVVCDFERTQEAAEYALKEEQIEPILI
ncbi:MAG: dipicolinate synthase subunit B [Acutalibacteraceae bacterium]